MTQASALLGSRCVSFGLDNYRTSKQDLMHVVEVNDPVLFEGSDAA